MTTSTRARALVVLAFSIALISSMAVPLTAAPGDFTLTILHSNDGDSQLLGVPGNPDYGGVARFKQVVEDAKTAITTDDVVLVSSGDFFAAGNVLTASRVAGIPFYEAVAADTIGYDAIALGKDDFGSGPEVLADFIDGFSVPRPPWVAANVDVSAEPALSPLAGTIVKSTTVRKAGEDIGILGVTTPDLSGPGGVVVDPDLAAAVQAEVDALTASGVDKIILLSHLLDIDNEVGLAALLHDVDVIVAGGGRELLANPGDLLIPGDAADGPYPMVVKDNHGLDVPVVTTNGDFGYLGELKVTFDAAGRLTAWEGAPIRVSGVAHPAVTATVAAPLSTALAQADLGGQYVFQGVDPNGTVLVMTVRPWAGLMGPTSFGTDVIYQLNVIDTPTPSQFDQPTDTAYRVTFGSPDVLGDQAFSLYRAIGTAAQGHSIDPANLVHSGTTNQVSTFDTGSGTATFFAGLRSDPHFFDREGWQGFSGEVVNGRMFDDVSASDFFAGRNVLAIVLELPDAALPDQTIDPTFEGLALWSSSAVANNGGWDQVDREGRPFANDLFNSRGSVVNAHPAYQDLFRTSRPDGDDFFTQQVKDSLAALSTTDSEGAFDATALDLYASVFLPDRLPFNKADTGPRAVPGVFSGRRLEDDVADIQLNIVTGGDPLGSLANRDSQGAVTTDGIGPHSDYLSVFPYLGEPNPVTLPTGTIVIVKDAQPDDAQDFVFSGDLGSFSLDDDADPALPNTATFPALAPGTYVVTEAAAAGWALTGLECTDDDAGTTTAGTTATIDLDAGETITCTFTNRALPTANPDSYETSHGTLLDAPSVLDNDTDPAGGLMFAIKDSDPLVGQLDFLTSGVFRYTPPAGFSGDVTFEYHIAVDGVDSDPALVTITVGQPTGTVSGSVLLDGVPLAGVEVWLAEGFGTGGQINHYTCTDGNGMFSFPGIALGVPLVSATGPSISAGCGNGDFVDPANGAHLQTQYYDHRHVFSMADVFTLPTAPPAAPTGRTAMTLRYDILYEGHNLGMVDPSQGLWHLRAPFGQWVKSFYFGDPGDIPFVGDWDCDGVSTPGLFRQSDAFAYLRNSNSQGTADIRFFFGDPADIPLAGDFNGDGCDTLSLYRPSEQRFYIINELGQNEGGLGAADYTFDFGNSGDTPFVGDFDGDGIDEVGLHRGTTGLVYFENALIPNGGGGAADVQFLFGDAGDRFAAGDWVASGFDAPGLFRPSDETWYLKFANTQGNADATIAFGESPWLPVAGFWGLPRTAP